MSYLAYLLKCENPIHCEQFHGFITCSCGFLITNLFQRENISGSYSMYSSFFVLLFEFKDI